MKFSTIFFDLGSTLVYSKEPWPPFYEQADRALADVLGQAGFDFNLTAFYKKFGSFIRSYYDKPAKNNLEKTTYKVLQNMLIRKGFRDVPDSILRAALEALYAVTQQNWYLEKDAIPTLKTLKSHGYHLGMISNTSDDHNVQGIVDHWGLRPFFDTIITSAALGIRKPDHRIFQVAMDKIQVQPSECVMVGDTLSADILGANQVGIFSIWITRRIQTPEVTDQAIEPNAVITSLSQIPKTLSKVGSYRAKGLSRSHYQ